MRELKHLSEIYENYDTFIVDLWGVIHNGIVLNPKAIEAIDHLKKNFKKIIFLSNAPRPSANVINFLMKMKMKKKYLSNVMTSGEAAMHQINNNKFGKTFFHLGPPRDISVITASTPPPSPTSRVIVFVVNAIISNVFPEAGSVDLGYGWSDV